MPTSKNNGSNRRFYEMVFDEEKHLYYVDGKVVPSVTEILAPLHRSYGSLNPSVLDYARRRGTAVHEELEMLDLTGDLEWTPETAPYIQAYLEWCTVFRPTWTAVEKPVFCEELWYAGTLDRMGYLNDGKLAIVDIKTSQPTREAYVSVCLQTMAYAFAVCSESYGMTKEECKGINRYGLFLMKDGKYRLLDCKEWENTNHIDAETSFAMLLATNKMVTKLLEKKGSKKDE